MNDKILDRLMQLHAIEMVKWLDEGGEERAANFTPLRAWCAVIRRLQELELFELLSMNAPTETRH